jgi:hypothetical protein
MPFFAMAIYKCKYGLSWLCSLKKKVGDIFDACRISATRISTPKRLTVGENKNVFFFGN